MKKTLTFVVAMLAVVVAFSVAACSMPAKVESLSVIGEPTFNQTTGELTLPNVLAKWSDGKTETLPMAQLISDEDAAKLEDEGIHTLEVIYADASIDYTLEIKGAKGDKGDDGKSAYELWLEIPANEGKTEAQFLESLKGSNGTPGATGNGIDKVEVDGDDLVITYTDGSTDTIEDFMLDVAGTNGKSAYELWIDECFDGYEGDLTTGDFFKWLANGAPEITATIETEDFVWVTDKEELFAAKSSGVELIVIGCDIDYAGDLVLRDDIIIDFNGNTITGCIAVKEANVTLRNGRAVALVRDWYAIMLDVDTMGVTVNIENMVAEGAFGGFYTNGTVHTNGATVNVNGSRFIATEPDGQKGNGRNAAAYLAGTHTINFTDCYFEGGTGVHIKAGTYSFVNCEILADSAYIAPEYWGKGGNCTGSALYLEPTVGYGVLGTVTVKNCTLDSENAYGIEHVNSSSGGSTHTSGDAVVVFEGTNEISGEKGELSWTPAAP